MPTPTDQKRATPTAALGWGALAVALFVATIAADSTPIETLAGLASWGAIIVATMRTADWHRASGTDLD